MPRIHARGVGGKPARIAAVGRDNKQFAVGHEQHVVLCLSEHDPLTVGRVLGKEVALAIVRGAGQRLGLAAAPAVKRHAVEVKLVRLVVFDKFRHVLFVQQHAGGVG